MSSKKDDKEREIAEKKAGKKGKKKRSGIPAIVLLLALIALLLYIFLGNGFGLGDKMGFGKGDGDTEEETTREVPSDEPVLEEDAEIPSEIHVLVEEKTVTINGHEASDAETLKAYIEKYNSDSVKFYLEDKQAILDTYNMVTDTFDELGIEYYSVR